MSPKTIIASGSYAEIDEFIETNNIKTLFLVCGKSFMLLKIAGYFEALGTRKRVKVVKFCDFEPNPSYDSIVKGVEAFRENNCDAIIAVGGGSAIDVAKCIKLYAYADPHQLYLNQKIVPNGIQLLAVPTTAGSGSEATHYAVIYFEGEKQSISDRNCLPAVAVLDASGLESLPDYHRKSTMLDALCHGIESFWSVNSTIESRIYSGKALGRILDNMDLYLANDPAGNANMLYAANISGRAIDIARTTAGHAMCYKLTNIFGIAHGHAAALCVSRLWWYMMEHLDQCVDPRGPGHLERIFGEIAHAMGYGDAESAAAGFGRLVDGLGLAPIAAEGGGDVERLVNSVNADRLKNNPVLLNAKALTDLYHEILELRHWARER